MTQYQRSRGSPISKTWRRNRAYTLQELRHLADRNRAKLVRQPSGKYSVVHAATGKVLAEYSETPQVDHAIRSDDRPRAFATLKLAP